jgi:Flp pilus assembly pilin Flp
MAGHKTAGRVVLDTRGASTVEYTLVLALIAAAAVSSWRALGDDVMRHVGRAKTSVRDHITIGKEER